MNSILINIIGLVLIFIIAAWFWFYKKSPKTQKVSGVIEIKVKDGVYQPANISAAVNQPITLRFIREDATPCAEFVIFDKLNINKQLPLNKPTDIPLTLNKTGEYEFTCQMGMYRGKLVIA
ncbi:MAG TPA: cupredoxin domain-containing protein [Gammaproteobacteria bacterium]|nr:cupredoxin domain-containing protein [Gammaproteobacteria bacterium]